MKNTANHICPICKTEHVTTNTCPTCSYPFAGVQYFASENTWAKWRKSVTEKQEDLLSKLQTVCMGKKLFRMNKDSLLLRSPKTESLNMITANGLQNLAGVIEVGCTDSVDGDYYFLNRDGTVSKGSRNQMMTSGDQGKKLPDFRNIKSILATDYCIYGVTNSGTVEFSGQRISRNESDWTDVGELVSGDMFIAGLRKDGKVSVSGIMSNSFAEEVSSWKNIKKLAATDNALIALDHSGQVFFAGKENDSRCGSSNWRNMVDVAVERTYAVGLQRDGKIALAGKPASERLDHGRTEAVLWENVIAISAERSAIGAVTMDGSLKLAGIVRDKQPMLQAWSSEQKEFCKELYDTVKE